MSEYNITTICSWRNYSRIMRLATPVNGWNPQIKQYWVCWGWRKNVNTGQWEMLLTRSCTMFSWMQCNVEAILFSSQVVYGWGQTTWVYLINKTPRQINYSWTLHTSVRVCSPWERCLGRCTSSVHLFNPTLNVKGPQAVKAAQIGWVTQYSELCQLSH